MQVVRSYYVSDKNVRGFLIPKSLGAIVNEKWKMNVRNQLAGYKIMLKGLQNLHLRPLCGALEPEIERKYWYYNQIIDQQR